MRARLRSSAGGTFATNNCSRVDVEIRSSLEKFNFREFGKAFLRKGGMQPKDGVLFSAVASTQHSETSDFHVHFSWYVSRGYINLTVEYVEGRRKPDPGERAPFAEGVVPWLGQFFKSPSAGAHVHALFRYPRKKWRAILPIPMRFPAKAREDELEVDGLSVSLPRRPEGVGQVWLIVGTDTIRMTLAADRTVHFGDFSIASELGALSAVAVSLVEEIAHENQ